MLLYVQVKLRITTELDNLEDSLCPSPGVLSPGSDSLNPQGCACVHTCLYPERESMVSVSSSDGPFVTTLRALIKSSLPCKVFPVKGHR